MKCVALISDVIITNEAEVTVVAGNAKRMDPKAYGVVDRSAWVKMVVGNQEKLTTRVSAPTLDPIWEQTFEFDITDPEVDVLTTTFYFGEVQIGIPSIYKLNELIQNKHTFKGMPVFGGKVDLTVKAIGFGLEDKPVEYSFMDDLF